MEFWNLIASWTGWSFIVALLIASGGYGLWVLSNRIERLKENNEFLKMKLDDANNSSPDVLIERLATRHRILQEELERLHGDEQANKLEISRLRAEQDDIATKLVNVVSKLFTAIDSVGGHNCVYCSDVPDKYSVQVPAELAGKKFVFDMNVKCYKCGRRQTQFSSVGDGLQRT